MNQTDGVEGPGLEPFCRVTIGLCAQHRSHISDYRRPHLRLQRLQALDDDGDDGSAHTAVSNTSLCRGASAQWSLRVSTLCILHYTAERECVARTYLGNR